MNIMQKHQLDKRIRNYYPKSKLLQAEWENLQLAKDKRPKSGYSNGSRKSVWSSSNISGVLTRTKKPEGINSHFQKTKTSRESVKGKKGKRYRSKKAKSRISPL
mmetsp:Transcript_34458/g.52732  ORF Transcript_34458/g.52732 Transcript_34458/m.52732 type:complete len:104 (+) Transcript_34458:1514-1825(+)